MDKPYYLDVVHDVMRIFHPKARCGFVAGSITRGEGTATSDIDLIIVYDEGDATPYRNSRVHDGWPVEEFIHTLPAQDYYFNQDIKNGVPTMITMIGEGIILGPDLGLAQERQEKALALYQKGPTPLSQDEIEAARYFITDQMDDIRAPRNEGQRMASLTAFYHRLGNFYLRAQGKWSGNGKHLFRRMERDNPDLATQYHAAFYDAFQGRVDHLYTLTENILHPFGGWHWIGYKSVAEPKWKETP